MVLAVLGTERVSAFSRMATVCGVVVEAVERGMAVAWRCGRVVTVNSSRRSCMTDSGVWWKVGISAMVAGVSVTCGLVRVRAVLCPRGTAWLGDARMTLVPTDTCWSTAEASFGPGRNNSGLCHITRLY